MCVRRELQVEEIVPICCCRQIHNVHLRTRARTMSDIIEQYIHMISMLNGRARMVRTNMSIKKKIREEISKHQ